MQARRIRLTSSAVALVVWLSMVLGGDVRAADPLRVVLLVDSSTSMANMLNEFRAGLIAFIQSMPDGVEVAFISTGGQLRIRVPPTMDKAKLLDAASRFASDGGANSLLDTLLESDKRFLKSAANRRPLFVVLTTDQPTANDASIYRYNDFLRDFVKRRGRAHGVVIRSAQMGLASEILENLTNNTDGLYTVMAVANSLPTRMTRIAAEIAAQQ
jgi:Mg-chelatase subunit ChlD